jgi:hypothetical protein
LKKTKSVLIVVDNLRVGGIQRLAIDECYSLNKRGIKHLLVSLEAFEEYNSIVKVDEEFEEISQLKLKYLRKGKFRQLFELTKLVNQDFNLIVTHSATAALLLRLATILRIKKVKVILYIHQLISLSSKKQALKRFFYFTFAHKLFVSSNQFKLEIEAYLKDHWWGFLFRKKIYFDRMGIYLNRVENQPKKNVCKEAIPHLIFASRMTIWKGFHDFFNLASRSSLKNHKVIFEIFKDDYRHIKIQEIDENRDHLFYSKSPVSFKYPSNSLHIYPTNYGASIKFPQSIGMNVLEFLALGVPSLISAEGFESWPELEKSVLIETCNWSDSVEVENKLNKLLSINEPSARAESLKLREFISIEQHIMNVVSNMSKEKKNKIFSRVK